MAREIFPFNTPQRTDESSSPAARFRSPITSSPATTIASERLSLRVDCRSKFFDTLCQRYRPQQRIQPTGFGAELTNLAVAPILPVNWNRHIPIPDDAEFSREVAEPKPLPPKYRGGVLQKTIYVPHGKWSWAAGLAFRETEPSVRLSSGIMCAAFVKTGHIGLRPVKLISKMWLVNQDWYGFFSELALYKVQLRSLQSRVVPSIVNVYSCTGGVDVAMEPPHHSFWIEASPDMPCVLKRRCVEAFEKIHAAGVHHGDVELRHMLIGGDARVTIIDFQKSRALQPNPAVTLLAATPGELRLEMRKVKFKLDYEDARAREGERLMRAARLAQKNQRVRRREDPIPEDVIDPPIPSREWIEEWDTETPEPRRFLMPGQSAEDVELAVEEFLDVLEKLEESNRHQSPMRGEDPQRRASPEFKSPIVPLPSPTMELRVSESPRASPRLRDPDHQPPLDSLATGITTRSMTRQKRKADSDVDPQKRKQVRTELDSTRIRSHSPPSSREAVPLAPHRPLPVVKIRDFAYEEALPYSSTLPPSVPMPHFDAPSSTKRKRPDDAHDVSEETRGRPKMRTSVACDVSQSHRKPAAPSVPPNIAQSLFPTSLLPVRFLENMWRWLS
ncbi:Serine/threonine protein kinase [Favolaschia claudopus]|uniref:Serine/threonine protein kinase n=1 Tax=Favolaschia claudopus TaxID=2862362 RepID=A0AAW0EG94_9AGAR